MTNLKTSYGTMSTLGPHHRIRNIAPDMECGLSPATLVLS